MWIGPAIAATAGVLLAIARPAALIAAVPVLALWFASPAVAWWMSRPLMTRRAELTVDQTLFLRKVARKTWAFFETFVGPEDHWLPPDNYQEYPAPAIAHRTSPTNMGMALLANLSAYDFGYIEAGRADRTDRTGAPDHGGHGAAPGAFLQLVRHSDTEAAIAPLRLDGG